MAEPVENRSNSELRREVARLRAALTEYSDLVRWLAPRIERRNMNGQPSDRFCLICSLGQPQYKKMPCRHGEIWRLAAAGVTSVTENTQINDEAG